MLNKVILIGRLTKDPELRRTKAGEAVTSFTLAVNRDYKSDETDFISVIMWRKLAENVNEYCHKGSLVAVEGSIRTRSYKDKDGRNVYVTEVLANRVQFLDSKKKDDFGITEDDIEF